jgi:long-chain acyl-CoA synthetase
MHATLISGDRTLPGDELERRILRLAGGLQAMGLQAGDVAGILMRNDFPFLEVTLAAERVGVVPVPLNWHASGEEIAYILEDSQARALFAHSDLLKLLAAPLPDLCQVIEVAPPPEIRQAYKLTEAACARGSGADYEEWLDGSGP